eukprot:jgi/Tetstr1/434056/TSEL_023200.t1
MVLRLRAMVDRMWGRLGLARHPAMAHPEPTQRLKHMDLIGLRAADFMSATPKPRSVTSHLSKLNLFTDFCALLDADTPTFIVRYISWAADRGRNKAGAFQPYLSAVNTFFRD